MPQLRSLCVFCGANDGADPAYGAAAERLGRLIAEAGIRLVYGGGGLGLMGRLARSVMAAGGEVVGVIPQALELPEIAFREASELIVVDSMHTRKKTMFDLSDAFAVLPGGMGTLDETVEMITWAQLGLHAKPIILVNQDEYWSGFRDWVGHMISQGFARRRAVELFSLVNGVDEVLPLARDLLGRAPEAVALDGLVTP